MHAKNDLEKQWVFSSIICFLCEYYFVRFYRSHREMVRSPTYLKPCNDELFKYSLKFWRQVTLKSPWISFSNVCHFESSRSFRFCIMLIFEREIDIVEHISCPIEIWWNQFRDWPDRFSRIDISTTNRLKFTVEHNYKLHAK